MLTPIGMPVTAVVIREFVQTVEFMKDMKAVNAVLQKEAAEAASKMAEVRSLEREGAKRDLKAHTDLVV